MKKCILSFLFISFFIETYDQNEYSIETKSLIPAGLGLSSNLVFARQSNCAVKVALLSGSYSGSCKNGLAHGKGIAQGIDRYEGQFRMGSPNGKGIYTWSDGTYYAGQWRDGKREGEGQMVYKDSSVYGIWKDDIFFARKVIPPFSISRTLSYARCSIKKVSKSDNNIRIRFYRGGAENADMDGLDLFYNSGDEYHSDSYVGIQNPRFPIDIKVKFRAMNYFHTQSHDVIVEFTINEPGTWEVVITY